MLFPGARLTHKNFGGVTIINAAAFYEQLKENGINFFTGVPDSLLQDFCACVSERVDAGSHVCAANEGNAAAIAAGHYLATGDPALVYMQNSGLGNVVNPATSLLDPLVYSIPVLFLIGWRGEPGIKDEPQHIKQGQITIKLLQTLGIKHAVLPRSMEAARPLLKEALAYMRRESAPFALVVSKDTFATYHVGDQSDQSDHTVHSPYSSPFVQPVYPVHPVQDNHRNHPNHIGHPDNPGHPDKTDNFDNPMQPVPVPPVYPLSREEALKIIIGQTGPRDIIVSTTGKASREIFEYREEKKDGGGGVGIGGDFGGGVGVGSEGGGEGVGVGSEGGGVGEGGEDDEVGGGGACCGGDHSRDFLTVGSMGHSSQIALGIALAKPDRKVYCLDGDGALIMHMGGMAVIGELAPANFMHIVINNGAHESVGGQPTAGFKIDIPAIARACGYKTAVQAADGDELRRQLKALTQKQAEAPILLEVRVRTGARKNLGRPTTTPIQNKKAFMRFLRQEGSMEGSRSPGKSKGKPRKSKG